MPDAATPGSREARVAVAQELYRAKDYPNAVARGLEVIADHPADQDATWVVIASSCALGETEQAQRYLPAIQSRRLRRKLIARCASLGATLAP